MGDGMRKAVVLVGHGGVPKDYPHYLVITLQRLEAQRLGTGGDPSEEERELDRRIRHWPRTPRTEPYKYGLESQVAHLKGMLDGTLFALAYNEFCAPTLEEAVEEVIAAVPGISPSCPPCLPWEARMLRSGSPRHWHNSAPGIPTSSCDTRGHSTSTSWRRCLSNISTSTGRRDRLGRLGQDIGAMVETRHGTLRDEAGSIRRSVSAGLG